MTRDELRTDLTSKSWMAGILLEEQVDLAVADGTDLKLYRYSILEAGEVSAIDRAIFIYVYNEGLGSEKAWYKNAEPERTINETHWLVRKYASSIASKYGEVVRTDDEYIIVDGLELQTVGEVDVMVPTSWFATEVNGSLVAYKIS